jgi:hypothetical protein
MNYIFVILGRGLVFCTVILSVDKIIADESKLELFPFSVEAKISTDFYHSPNQTTPYDTLQSSISFSWSNGLWQIEQATESIPKFVRAARGTNVTATRIMNCKRVPDGVRYYSLFQNSANEAAKGHLPVVEVIPTAFPPINFREQLLSWLALCPNPELPIVSSNQMQRFTSQRRLNEADNVGNYHASYLETNAFFLSDLSISDNGVIKHLDGTVRHREPPFAEGFIDFHFRTLETTNVNGVLFPKRAELRLLSPLPNAKNQDDSWPVLVCSLNVEQIRSENVEFQSPKLNFFVRDSRIPTKPGLIPLRYIVTNDVFAPKANKRLIALASIKEKNLPAKNGSAHIKQLVIRWVVVCVAVLPLIVAVWFKLKTTNKK